ncbi:MAG: hypothetical protein RL198_785 [Actinomycetota bacterium]
MVGLGTLINVLTILLGTALGVLLGGRLKDRTNQVVTDGLGLVTLVLGALNVAALLDAEFISAVGSGFTLLVVLAAILLGGLTGSLLRIEQRLESIGDWLQLRFAGRGDKGDAGRERFITGFVSSSLIFTIGPLAILGAISDGLGQGIDQLALKSTLDGFAAIAFAAAMGWGVAFSALPVGIWQGLVTLIALGFGSLLGPAEVSAMTATGGLLLIGIALRLLNIRQISVADLLPALVFAPAIAWLVGVLMTGQ